MSATPYPGSEFTFQFFHLLRQAITYVLFEIIRHMENPAYDLKEVLLPRYSYVSQDLHNLFFFPNITPDCRIFWSDNGSNTGALVIFFDKIDHGTEHLLKEIRQVAYPAAQQCYAELIPVQLRTRRDNMHKLRRSRTEEQLRLSSWISRS